MTSSITVTETTSFTLTHAKYLAAKVATDLKRMQRLYGSPSDARIAQFEGEVTALLKAGYLGTVTYGFRRDGKLIPPTLRYSAKDLAGTSAADDDPGRVPYGLNIQGASFYSFLTYNSAWDGLSLAQQTAFEGALPVQRGTSTTPGVDGYFTDDRSYSAGGQALNRSIIRSQG
jgi:hypothetical protein